MAWGWLKAFGKGAAKAAPLALDIASAAMPGPAALAAHKGADVIREIQHNRETASVATPPFVPIPAQLIKAAEEVVSTVVAQPATQVVTQAIAPLQMSGTLTERMAALQQYVALLKEVMELERQLRGENL